jgi:hypothetical protein
VGRGDIQKSSFAFSVRGDGERWDVGANPPVRELLNLNLYDVAPVDAPYYPDTSVALRSVGNLKDPLRNATSGDSLLRLQTALEIGEAKRKAGLPLWRYVTGSDIRNAATLAAELRVLAVRNGRHLDPKPIGYIEGVRAQIADLNRAAAAKGADAERSASGMFKLLRTALAAIDGHRPNKYALAKMLCSDAAQKAPTARDKQECLRLSFTSGSSLVVGIEQLLGEFR